jgi:hypothetical protein
VSITINGSTAQLPDDRRVSLLDLLREHLHLSSAKKGCDQGACGACTALVDGGKRILSCLAERGFRWTAARASPAELIHINPERILGGPIVGPGSYRLLGGTPKIGRCPESCDQHPTSAGWRHQTMLYANPNTPGAKVAFKPAYDNFINGKFVPPLKGQYFDAITPITGKPFTKAARSGAEDIELALDVAHAAADKWGPYRARHVRRLQGVRHRPGDTQDDV